MTPPVDVDIQNTVSAPVDDSALVRAAQYTAQMEGVTGPAEVSIVLTTDEHVAMLNLHFRGLDAPTDILSFPADPLPGDFGEEARYLGDLVIAFPYASRQAAREGHALLDSLQLLVVYGMLHLLGWDHDTPEHRAAMWARQDAALLALGISPALVPPLEDDTHA